MKKLLVILLGLIVLAGVMGDCSTDSPSPIYSAPRVNKVRTQTTSRVRTQNWFEVDENLCQATVKQWKKASPQSKLAAAGGWLSVSLWQGHLNSLNDYDKLKIKAYKLVRALDGSLSAIPVGNDLENSLVNEYAAFLISLANDLGPDS